MRTIISLSIQPDEDKRIREIAILENKTVSEYIRSVLRNRWDNSSEKKILRW